MSANLARPPRTANRKFAKVRALKDGAAGGQIQILIASSPDNSDSQRISHMDDGNAEELFNAICERVPDAMSRHKVPGAALGIICAGQEFTRGFGVTSAAHPLPVNEKTLFQIGSITKTFTATAVMRLVEAGQLTLDEPIRTYLPDFKMRDPAVTAGVTMRHLMTHTGGWVGDYFPDTGNGDDALAKFVGLMADLQQLTPLGTVWSYNNAAFSLAGRVIEVVTGKTYETALKELVLAPLGLSRCCLFPTEVMLHAFAVGHTTVEDKSIVLRPWQLTRACTPAGGIAAPMKDLMSYARFHLSDGKTPDGTRILSSESIKLMQTAGVPAELEYKMGIAWWMRLHEGVTRVFHGGGTFGQLAILTLTPERNFALAMTTNSMSGGLVMRDALNDLVPPFLGYKTSEPNDMPMTTEQTSEYAGRYTAALSDLEIKVDDGKLMVQPFSKGGFPTSDIPPARTPPPPFRIAFIAKDRFAMIEPPMRDAQGEFLRDPDGSLAWLRWGGRIYARGDSGS
jgi:CubicO group peptidase (beta-lactamase class C family)